jgi:hypothetical protein
VLCWLGLLTFVRVLEKSIEDLYYARYFLLGGNDDVAGVFANMAT